MEKNNYQERLNEALSSEPIKPLYQKFVGANNLCKKITKHIFKPFIIVSSLAVLYAGANTIGSIKNDLDYFILKPEISSEVYSANRNRYQKALLASIGTAAGSAFLTLGILGGGIMNTGRKERKLEKALNEQGLSLDNL